MHGVEELQMQRPKRTTHSDAWANEGHQTIPTTSRVHSQASTSLGQGLDRRIELKRWSRALSAPAFLPHQEVKRVTILVSLVPPENGSASGTVPTWFD